MLVLAKQSRESVVMGIINGPANANLSPVGEY